MGELILQTQNPPFDKLGVMDLNTFFPEKDRFSLAMLLNNILAAPAFQTWIEGQALDVESLLWGADDRPRHSVFYLAHLTDAERMFFITLLYSAIETWMRTQPGATSLRALIYFDEIFGYAPPVSNPPTKALLLRMLKQARAYGVGQVLVTQNPVDLDYKGLSNAGTWFIGKLQTDNDKQRLLDGLQGAAGGSLDRQMYDQIIAGLVKREFLLHNVHGAQPETFRTRWVMNYLAGPLTRAQIPALNQLVGAKAAPPLPPDLPDMPLDEVQPVAVLPIEEETRVPAAQRADPPKPARRGAGIFPAQQPDPHGGVQSCWAATAGTWSSAKGCCTSLCCWCRPRSAISSASTILITPRSAPPWWLILTPAAWCAGRIISSRRWITMSLGRSEPLNARYALPEAPFTNARTITPLEIRFRGLGLPPLLGDGACQQALKLYAGPELTEGGFRKLASPAARKALDEEADELKDKFQKKFDALKKKLGHERRELEEDRDEHAQRKMEEVSTLFENLFGGRAYGRRRVTSSLSRRRLTQRAKAKIEESEDMIEEIERDIDWLSAEMEETIDELEEKWARAASGYR